jgi:hypothetical protein
MKLQTADHVQPFVGKLKDTSRHILMMLPLITYVMIRGINADNPVSPLVSLPQKSFSKPHLF